MVDYTPIAPNSAEPEVAVNAALDAFSDAIDAIDGSLPPGGTTGQVLAKASSANGDVIWKDDEQGSGGGGGGGLTLDVPYWRIFIPAGAGYYSYCITQLDFLDSTGAVIAATGGTSFCRDSSGTNGPDKAFDNDNSTFYSANAATPGNTYTSARADGLVLTQEWLGYQFTANKTVRGVKLKARGGSVEEAKQCPTNILLQGSLDGKSYYTIATFGGPDMASGEVRTWQL